jgi:hypothetical protein
LRLWAFAALRAKKTILKFGCGAALAEESFAGCIFGHMLFQLFAPQGLKCMAASIQGFEFGNIRPFTA